MNSHFSVNKKWAILTIVFLIVVSGIGVIDKYTDNYTNESIVEAGSAYAIARGINAIVSVLQSGTVNFGVGVGGSVAIGEALDPLNDLVERFSQVMTVALGSLVLQKILLVIASHGIFKLLIALSGMALIAVLWVKDYRWVKVIGRIFVLLIFVRFSLGIVVLLNSVVDNVFITHQITSETDNLAHMKEDMESLNQLDSAAKTERTRLIDTKTASLAKIKTKVLPKLKSDLSAAQSMLIDAENELEELKLTIKTSDRFNPFYKNKQYEDVKNKVSGFSNSVSDIENKISSEEEQVNELRDGIESPGGMIEKIKNGIPSFDVIRSYLDISNIEGKIANGIQNIINLMMLFILKTILIPILFFFAFTKGMKRIWEMEYEGVMHDREVLEPS